MISRYYLMFRPILEWIKRNELPDWTRYIIFPLLISTLISLAVFILGNIIWFFPARKSRQLKRDGIRVKAIATDTEIKDITSEDSNKEEYIYYLHYTYSTRDGQRFTKKVTCRSEYELKQYAKEPFYVYYDPANPKRHKREKEMYDIDEFRNMGKKAKKIFILGFFSVLLIMFMAMLDK